MSSSLLAGVSRSETTEWQEPFGLIRMAVAVVYLCLGLIETVLAYFAFGRTDDHTYFLALANGQDVVVPTGVVLYDLKAEIAAQVFYWITLPSRLLGGHELTHLLWLRVLTLAGFYAAFEAVRFGSSLDRRVAPAELDRRRNAYLILVLLYPGQLAWTASLLRDGVGCALLFAAMYAWGERWRVAALVPLGAALALRPEFALIPASLVGMRWLMRWRWIAGHPAACVLLLCVAGSLLSFEVRFASSQFALAAFSENNLAYPDIDSPWDVGGYVAVAVQGLIDPLPIGSLSPSPFGVTEALFFLGTISLALRVRLRTNLLERSRIIACLVLLWFFAYFEVFVSSYSRHRIALVVLLLAVIACAGARGRYVLRPVRNQVP